MKVSRIDDEVVRAIVKKEEMFVHLCFSFLFSHARSFVFPLRVCLKGNN